MGFFRSRPPETPPVNTQRTKRHSPFSRDTSASSCPPAFFRNGPQNMAAVQDCKEDIDAGRRRSKHTKPKRHTKEKTNPKNYQDKKKENTQKHTKAMRADGCFMYVYVPYLTHAHTRNTKSQNSCTKNKRERGVDRAFFSFFMLTLPNTLKIKNINERLSSFQLSDLPFSRAQHPGAWAADAGSVQRRNFGAPDD